MASLAQQFAGLRCPPLSFSRLSKPLISFSSKLKRASSSLPTSVVCAYALTNEQRERQELKQMFEEAYERCLSAPMEGVSFTVEDFEAAIEKDDLQSEIGTTVKGTVFDTNQYGAMVDIPAKTAAFLPVEEACIYRVRYLEEAGIFIDMEEEFLVIGEDRTDDALILSRKALQYDLAWERCRQLQAEDAVVEGRVIDANSGGLVARVEGLRGFIPFSQISSNETDEEALIGKELPLKFVEVDEENSRLVLSNRKAVADSQAQLGIGSVVTGTVQSLKPYGAFIDIGGINGLLHVSQISHDRVADIGTVLQPGDALKVMILSHDRGRGRVSLSTKKLEPTPGDMIRNPQLVFEKADEMAQTFRQRIAQAEAMARADMLRFQPESGLTLSSEGILGPLAGDQSLDFGEIPPAEDVGDDDIPEDEDDK